MLASPEQPREPLLAFPSLAALGSGLLLLLACGTRSQASQPKTVETPELCRQRRGDLIALVARLPDRAIAASVRVPLPASVLGSAPGRGSVLEISEEVTVLDGQRISGVSSADRIENSRAALQRIFSIREEEATKRPTVGDTGQLALYIAAAPSVDVQTLRAYLAHVPETVSVQLLVRARPQAPSGRSDAVTRDDEAVVRLLSERDPTLRAVLSARAFEAHSDCEAVTHALRSVSSLHDASRWPKLRAALIDALPRCDCGELETDRLAQLVVAEQRAGTASLAALPLGFIRDERCGASMPLRSVGKLLDQMESFDAEFAGSFREGVLRFDQVLTDSRLLHTFCSALPGETLAALERNRSTLYWRLQGEAECQAWQFEPIASGAPLGTWKRISPAGSRQEPLAFHYLQAAEEIRILGPVVNEPRSKPTDRREWPCEVIFRMVGVDAHSIELEQGRWFFTEAACRQASPEQAAFPGCVSSLSSQSPAAKD